MDDGRYAPGVLTGRVNGSEMRVDVLGGDWQKEEIAKQLRHLTALPKKTKDGTGELSLPLTWAIITQLANMAQRHNFKWQPDEALGRWIYDEFQRRFAEYKDPSDLTFDVSTLNWEPMPHQLSGMFTVALCKRFFFADEMGVGKSATAFLTLA